jgi:hypothetical protein
MNIGLEQAMLAECGESQRFILKQLLRFLIIFSNSILSAIPPAAFHQL